MKMLAETVISLFDLAEAEGRLLKTKVLQTAAILMLMSVAVFFFVTALALLLTALYYLFIVWWSPIISYFATALSSLILAGAISWISYHFSQKQ